MNERILHKDVQDFINQNLKSDITKLILKGSPFEQVSIQEIATQIVSKQKCEKKLPTWFRTENIYFPPKLNLEQTSSEVTADYKSNLVSGSSLLDLTGGLGIDTYYFSKHFKQVTHLEINTELSKIATHNFKKLEAHHIKNITSNGIDFLKKSSSTFDAIYIDPSRRNDLKGKVFLLRDCEPNIPENIDLLFERSHIILIKNSPILDITSTIKELKNVQQIHIVAVANEVKELLFLLKKSYEGTIEIKTVNFIKTKTQKFNFIYNSEFHVNYGLPENYMYEPNAAILKSGGFSHIASKFPVKKLHQHSHLYTSEVLIDFPGRSFKVKAILPYDKKKIKKYLTIQKANITTRNFPKTVAQIRKETQLKDGGSDYLFFTKNSNDQYICILCERA